MGNIGLGKYVESKITLGSGAFGTVIKATNRNTEQPVALKKMKKNAPNYIESLIFKEIEIGRKLQHPNLCKFIEYFNTSDSIILVLEYCTDGDLTDRIKIKGSNITLSDAQEWVYQILTGVKFMHSVDVCHRDIKPDNCMFTDSFDVLKLCDFGIATIVPKGELLTLKCGTLAFMSPEMVRCRYSLPCDIWAVGVVMYTILNENDHPFIKNGKFRPDLAAAGNVKFQKDVFEMTVGRLNRTASKEKKGAAELCASMCAVDPSQRPTAAQALDSKWLKSVSAELEQEFATHASKTKDVGCDLKMSECTCQ